MAKEIRLGRVVRLILCVAIFMAVFATVLKQLTARESPIPLRQKMPVYLGGGQAGQEGSYVLDLTFANTNPGCFAR